MFFVNKYVPLSVDNVTFHKDIIDKLKIISKDDSLPHLIFYGPPGSGKKTIINLLLEMLYDKSIHNMSNSTYTVSGSGNNQTEVIIKQSNYHIVIEPKNNNKDRYLIQEVVQEYAKRIPLNVFKTKKIFKTVLINNMDNLPYYAQTALRRMMEKYSDTCRFILWCRSLNRIIEPLISRCLTIRVPSPSNSEIFQYLYKISLNEEISLTLDEYTELVKKTDGNIKTGLWLLEMIKHGHESTNTYDREIDIIKNLIIIPNIANIVLARDRLYNLMITNVSKIKIFKDLLNSLLDDDNIPIESKYKIIQSASLYEYNLMRGRREIIHLEAFSQKVMKILYSDKNYVPLSTQVKKPNMVNFTPKNKILNKRKKNLLIDT